MKRIIYFDFDGTLADSMDLCINEIALTLERCGYPPVSLESLMACNGPSYMEAAVMLGIPEDDRERFNDVRLQAEWECIEATQKTFAGVGEMLKRLSGKATLGIVSNGFARYLFTSLEMLNLTDAFDFVQPLIEGQVKGETLRQLVEKQKPDAALMVGDRMGDFVAGKMAGIPTVAACYGFGNDQEYQAADFKVDSVQALSNFLVEWTQTV